MKRSFRFRLAILILAITTFGFASLSRAQAAAEPVHSGQAAANAGEKHSGEAQKDTESEETEAFRHSSAVQSFARFVHLDVETAAKIFEDLNSAIVIGAILWLLFKVLPKAFRSRKETIEKQLVEARTATEQANERLREVEKRLARLDDEIEAIRRSSEEETQGDEVRIKQTLEEERKRIVESAEHEIDAAGAAAQRQLKQFAAELAVDRAIRGIQLSADADRQLVESFGRDLGKGSLNGGRN